MARFLAAFCLFNFLSLLISTSAQTNAVMFPISKDTTTLQYLANLLQRTPAVPLSLTVDLDGSFLWVDCSRDYKSSSYGANQCGLAPCASFGPDQTCGDCHSGLNPSPGCHNNTCSVTAVNPITGKGTSGEVSSDILTVRSTDGSSSGPLVTAISDFVCGTTSLLKGLARSANGVVGIGRTRSALLEQFAGEFSDETFNFPRKFALCLPSSGKSTGFAIFGDPGKYVLLPGVDVYKSLQFTPLISNFKGGSVGYYLNVTSININGQQVRLNKSLLEIDTQGKGGTKISTVHPYTVLESSIFRSVVAAFTKALNGTRMVKPIRPFGACYESKGISSSRVGPAVPTIDLVLHKKSVFWRIFGANSMVQVSKDVMCLGFVVGGVKSGASIVIGGHQLEDNLVLFDQSLAQIGFSSSLLFRQTTCANFNFTSTA